MDRGLTDVLDRPAEPPSTLSAAGPTRPRWRFPWDAGVSSLLTVVLAVLVLLPIGFLIFSTFRTNLPGLAAPGFTLDNWSQALHPDALRLLGHTVLLAAVATICAGIIGVLLAWFVARTNMPGARILGSLCVLPMLVSPLLTSVAWIALAGPTAGFLNVFGTRALGLHGPILNIYSFHGMVLVLALHFAPYIYLVSVAALRSVDANLEDAARAAGSGTLTTLRSVVLPVVSPAVLSAAILVFVLSCEEFAVPLVLGPSAHFPTVQREIFSSMTAFPTQPTYAAALAVLLMVVSTSGIAVYRHMTKATRRFITIGGKGVRVRVTNLGRLRFVALAICLLYLAFAIVLPFAALVTGSFMKFVTPDLKASVFTLANYHNLFHQPNTGKAIGNTIIYGILGAIVITIFSGIISTMVTRRRTRVANGLEFLATAPLAIPSMSLALGLIWSYLYVQRYLHIPIYGTIWILLIAYVTRYTSLGMRTFSPAVLQLDPALEEASRVAGGKRLGTLGRITLPALGPAVVSVGTLLFVSIILDIGMTLFLANVRTTTLALQLWQSESGGFSVVAYGEAVVLAAIGFLVLAIGTVAGRAAGLARRRAVARSK